MKINKPTCAHPQYFEILCILDNSTLPLRKGLHTIPTPPEESPVDETLSATASNALTCNVW